MAVIKTRIFLAEDQQLLRESLVSLLNGVTSPTEFVGWAGTIEQMLEMLQSLHEKVQLILLDIRFPNGGMDGFDGLVQVKRLYPRIKVLILSEIHDRSYRGKATTLGADGYISKYASKEELLKAIDMAIHGQNPTFVPDDDFQPPPPPGDDEPRPELTTAENEVLCLTIQGYTADQISGMLNNAKHNIDRYRRILLVKFDVPNVAALGAKAIRLGFCLK